MKTENHSSRHRASASKKKALKKSQSKRKSLVSKTKGGAKGKKRTSSRILESVYEAARGMHESGIIDVVTMREFDSLCKKPVSPLTPLEIKKIRLKEKVSQPVFAWCLNVKPTTLKKWETGEHIPSGPALRLLNVIKDNGLGYIQ